MLCHRICIFFWHLVAIICFIIFPSLLFLMLILDIIFLKTFLSLFIHTEIPHPHLSLTIVAIKNISLKLMESIKSPLSWTIAMYHMGYIHVYISSCILISSNGEANHTLVTIFCCFSGTNAVICTALRDQCWQIFGFLIKIATF